MIDYGLLIRPSRTWAFDLRYFLLTLVLPDLRRLERIPSNEGTEDERVLRRVAMSIRRPMLPALISGVFDNYPHSIASIRALGALGTHGCSPQTAAEVIPPLLYALRDATAEEIQETACRSLEQFAAVSTVAAQACRDFRERQLATLVRRVGVIDHAYRLDSKRWRISPSILARELSGHREPVSRNVRVVGWDRAQDVAESADAVTAWLQFPSVDFVDMDEDKEEESTSAGLQGELIGSPFLVPPRHDNLDRRTAEERDRITRMLLNVSADVELQFPTDDAERRAAMLLERQGIAFLLSSPDAASPTRLSATVSLPLSNWAEYPDFACYLRWRENTDVTIGPAAPSGSYDYYSATVQTARRSAPQPGESLIFGSCDGEDDVFGLIRLDRYLNGSEHVHGYEAGERMFDATVYAFGDATRLASGSRLRRRIDWYENSTVFSRSPLDGATASVRFPVCIDNEIAKVHTVRSNTG